MRVRISAMAMVVLVGVVPVLAGPVYDPTEEKQVPETLPAATMAANESARRALAQPVPELEFKGAKVSDVIDALRVNSGAKLVVN